MALSEIKVGDVLACQEQETGQFGVLYVEADRIWVEFIGFGTDPAMDADRPFHLHTAKGWVVSFFDNVDFSPTMPTWRRGDVGCIYHKRILSNFVLVGETAWLTGERVQSAFFRLTPDCDFLWSNDLAAQIAEMPVKTDPDRTIIRVPVHGGEITLAFALHSDPVRDKWIPTAPGFTLRFDDAIEPRECLNRIGYLERLFALLTWQEIRSEEVSIRRTNAEERSYSHRVLSADVAEKGGNHSTRTISLTPLSAGDDVERHALQMVLRIWLEREAEWKEGVGADVGSNAPVQECVSGTSIGCLPLA
jgi:hypothetical protein